MTALLIVVGLFLYLFGAAVGTLLTVYVQNALSKLEDDD